MARPEREEGDNVALAVSAIVFTSLALSLGDALVRRISAEFTLWQIFVVRSAIALPVLIAILAVRTGGGALPRTSVRLGWIAARSLMLASMWVAYYAALPHLALSVAAAAYYTAPLFITLFAALLIGDRIHMKGWAAVFAGFCGVLLILRPHTEAFSGYSLLPILSAVLYAVAMILTRTRCRDEHPLILSLGLNLSFIAMGLLATVLIELWEPSSNVTGDPFLQGHWARMDARAWLAMAMLAVAVVVGSVGAAIAYQAGPPAIVATFDFSYVAFAALWGLLLFAETPEPLSVLGITLIVGAGALAVCRQ